MLRPVAYFSLITFSAEQRNPVEREPMGCFYGLDRIASGFDNLRVLSRSFDRNNNFFLEIFSNDIFILSRRKFYIFALRKMGENKSPPIFYSEHKEDVHMNDRIVHLGMTLQLFETDCKDISL